MLREISSEELANLPTSWENATVDVRKYYQNVLCAFEVDYVVFQKYKDKGGLCQNVNGRYYIA